MTIKKSRCIFCGGDGRLSKEHIFADWIKNYIPKLQINTKHHTTYFGSSPKKGKMNRPGDVHSQKLRIVCIDCNGGWMSGLQNNAKPYLVPLLDGDWSNFDENSIPSIVAWCAMFCMVYEFADPKTVVISSEERKKFFETKSIDKRWSIWVGNHEPSRQGGVQANHFGFKILDSKKEVIQVLQTTGFSVGRLFIQAFMADPLGYGAEEKAREFHRVNDMKQIWGPRCLPSTKNQPVRVYSSKELQKASCELAVAYGNPAFIYNSD